METHYLYCIVKKYKKRALTVNLVLDNFETQEVMPPSDRINSIDDMVAHALEASLLGYI